MHFSLKISGSNNFSDFPAHLHIIFQRMFVENVCIGCMLATCKIFRNSKGDMAQVANGKYAYGKYVSKSVSKGQLTQVALCHGPYCPKTNVLS